jgi:phosphoribosyl-ATP pyrophosphohydrolase/phosphoribosyl-AMP cyclohydrolase/histidinol dehydrogenase
MTQCLLPRRRPADFLEGKPSLLPTEVCQEAEVIVERIRAGGEPAIREYATRFGERRPDQSLFISRDELRPQLEALAPSDRGHLERIGERIRAFAVAQRDALTSLDVSVPGGTVGHRIDPVDTAGCYAPGGRYPLPSSVLMTAVTARAAGVGSVWVASPRPAPITLAAAAIADVDGVLGVGGAHAIAGLAFGVGPVPPSDVVVGPGNLYVTAAKQLLAGAVAIDMLAGPSELLIIADESADPAWIAADLLAQAEHDPEAVPILIAMDPALIPAVEAELHRRLADLPTAETALAALGKGGVVACPNVEEAVRVSNAIAPEHLQLCVASASDLVPRFNHYGAIFIGECSAEVFGDYGVGPNHVLPTSGTSRARGGLSVMDFLRVRTWIQLDGSGPSRELVEDSAWMARQEGLEAHARAAELRWDEPGLGAI